MYFIHFLFTVLFWVITPNIVSQNNKLNDSQAFYNKDSINKFIINYYQQEFATQEQDYPDALIKVDTIDGLINIKHQLYKESDYGPVRIIPASSEFITGYLNDDHKKDLIVSVYSTEGGQDSWLDIFVFISKNNQLQFFKKYTSFDLGYCKRVKGKAKFYPAEIINKTLVGETRCFTPKDPRCCPSGIVKTTFKFNNGLKLVSQLK